MDVMTYAEETRDLLAIMIKYTSALNDWTKTRQGVLSQAEMDVILAAARPMVDLTSLISGQVLVIPGLLKD